MKMKDIFVCVIFFIVADVFFDITDFRIGVAGAGFDKKSVIQKLESYPGYMSPLISESTQKNCGDKVTQQFDNIFDEFPKSISRLKGYTRQLSEDLTVGFSNREFFMKDQDLEYIVTEKLPSAFYMHPMQVGMMELDENRVVIVVNRSRATTGKIFVAIYLDDGEIIYRKILSSSDVWDIAIDDNNNILIKGACNTRVLEWVDVE
jgi:hypothetical protein